MANFTPQMLRDLLASPDPKDQELAQQLSAMEFSNENARLGNYPAPDAARPPTPTAPGVFAPQVPDAPVAAPPPVDQSTLNSQYVQGNIGPGGSGGMAAQNMPFPSPQPPQPPQPVAPPAPDPAPQALVPNQFRNETTGKVTTLSPPGAAAGAATPGAGQEPGVRVLDQMLQANGQIFQLIEKETPTGTVRTTRMILPDANNPAVANQLTLDTERAKLAHVNAQTAALNAPGETTADAAEKAFQLERAKIKAQSGATSLAGA